MPYGHATVVQVDIEVRVQQRIREMVAADPDGTVRG
jgi:hypothetical protein